MSTLAAAAEAIWQAVSPTLPGFSVEVVQEIDSTNSELMRRARAQNAQPVLLVARHQSAGRGRMGKHWDSDGPLRDASVTDAAASLTFSLGLPLHPASWSGLSLAVGLSLVQSLHPDLRLKWPNDVLLHGRKLAGILVETASMGSERYVVVGVGVNVAPRASRGYGLGAAALQEVWPQAQPSLVLAQVVPALVAALRRFEQEGFAPLCQAYALRDALMGQSVVCTDGTHGVAQGVDAQGALLVHTAHGVVGIHSAEVSVRPQAGAGVAV